MELHALTLDLFLTITNKKQAFQSVGNWRSKARKGS